MSETISQRSGAVSALEIGPSYGSSARDFDFLYGAWKIQNKKLKSRLNNCDEWFEFKSECACGPILKGFANQDFFHARIDGEAFEATTIRLFNPKTRLWTIYWADSNNVVMDIPMVGSFDGDVGIFLARDVWERAPIIVKFNWDKSDPENPAWSQAFSADEGKSWEWNWFMSFSRRS